MPDYPEKIVKPIANADGTYGKVEYKLDRIEGVKITGPEKHNFRGESFLQSVRNEMESIYDPYIKQMNEPGLIFPFNTISGATMSEVTYGRLVRIPSRYSASSTPGHGGFLDVTVKDAKAEAKRLRKLAKQIEKATR